MTGCCSRHDESSNRSGLQMGVRPAYDEMTQPVTLTPLTWHNSCCPHGRTLHLGNGLGEATMRRNRRAGSAIYRLLCSTNLAIPLLLMVMAPSAAQVFSMPGREAPTAPNLQTYAVPVSAFANVPTYGTVQLSAPSNAETIRAKAAARPDAIGIGRAPGTFGGTVRINVPAGETQARVTIASESALYLRVAIGFDDNDDYSIAAWAPGDANAVPMSVSANRSFVEPTWSPLTVGGTQEKSSTKPRKKFNCIRATVSAESRFAPLAILPSVAICGAPFSRAFSL